MDSDEFQLTSKLFYIYPEYKKIEGAHNFDVCLIQTPQDNNGIHVDLSTSFDSIPCFAEEIDLSKVNKCNTINSDNFSDRRFLIRGG